MFFCSLFHTYLFARILWETKQELFLLLGCRQKGAAHCVARKQDFESLTFESREGPRHYGDKSPCLKYLMYDCSCLTIFFAPIWTRLQITEFRRRCSHTKPHCFLGQADILPGVPCIEQHQSHGITEWLELEGTLKII